MKFTFKILTLFLCVQASALAQDLSPCSNENGLYGFCDQSGSVVIDHKFDDAFGFINGHAPVKDGDKWGIIDQHGTWMVKPVYDEVLNCDNAPELILVRNGKKWSMINAYGIQMTHEYEVELPLHEFEITNSTAHFHEDDWFAVIKNGKWGAVNVNDEVKIRFMFDWLRILKSASGSRFAVLKKDGKFGWSFADDRDFSGFIYDEYLGVEGDFAFFKNDKKPVVLDIKTGKESTEAAHDFYALVNADDKMGLVDSQGNEILPFQYHFVHVLSSNGIVIFGEPGAMGIADLSGQTLLRPAFQVIRPLESGSEFLKIQNDQRKMALYKTIDGHLTNITGFVFDSIEFNEGIILVTNNSQEGTLTMDGEVEWIN